MAGKAADSVAVTEQVVELEPPGKCGWEYGEKRRLTAPGACAILLPNRTPLTVVPRCPDARGSRGEAGDGCTARSLVQLESGAVPQL